MKNIHFPNAWLVLDIHFLKEKRSVLKVLSSYNDELGVPAIWRLNSGIAQASKFNNTWTFIGSSGSIYYCDINNYEVNYLMKSALNGLHESYVNKSDLKIIILELCDLKEISNEH